MDVERASLKRIYGSKYVEQTTIQKFQQVSIYKLCNFSQKSGILAALQCALLESIDTHRYGSSPLNQQIENWWSHNKHLLYGIGN